MNFGLQDGQSSTEYIVVTAAIVFAMLQPIVPAGSLSCPESNLQSIQSQNAGSDSCSIVEVFGQLFRNRSEGYTYAISSSEYPELLVQVDEDIFDLGFDDDDDSGSGSDSGGSSGGSDTGAEDEDDDGTNIDDIFDDYTGGDIGGDMTTGVAVDDSGEIIGTINSDNQVEDDDGNIIGVVMDDGSIVAADSDGNITYDDEGNTTPLGEQASINSDGDIVTLDGDVVGNVNE